MTDREAIDVDLAWRNLVVAGRQSQIDQLLIEIEQLLPSPSWERNVAAEQRPPMREGPLSRSRCYTRHLQNRDVRLWLLRRSDYRLDGGLVEPTDFVRYHDDIAEAIFDFRKRVLEPAVRTCGLLLSRNSLGPLSWVTADVLERLWAFYDSSSFRWPPEGGAALKWHEFVVGAYQAGAAFDPGEFSAWLTTKGWSAGDASAVTARFYSEAASLSASEDLRQPV